MLFPRSKFAMLLSVVPVVAMLLAGGDSPGRPTPGGVSVRHAPLLLDRLPASAFGDWDATS